MKIIITMDLDDEYADPGHSTGVTAEGYDKLDALLNQVGTDIEVSQA